MNDQERQIYEELFHQQEIKQGKIPFKQALREDMNVSGVFLMWGSFVYAPIIGLSLLLEKIW